MLYLCLLSLYAPPHCALFFLCDMQMGVSHRLETICLFPRQSLRKPGQSPCVFFFPYHLFPISLLLLPIHSLLLSPLSTQHSELSKRETRLNCRGEGTKSSETSLDQSWSIVPVRVTYVTCFWSRCFLRRHICWRPRGQWG